MPDTQYDGGVCVFIQVRPCYQVMNPDRMDAEKQAIRCEVEGIWRVLGRAWALPILKSLSAKDTIRFNELKKLLSGISGTVLSDRLGELEREGLVSKKIYAEVPPRVEYSLTRQARELEAVLDALDRWAKKWESQKPGKK